MTITLNLTCIRTNEEREKREREKNNGDKTQGEKRRNKNIEINDRIILKKL
jgi:hypothetical protein